MKFSASGTSDILNTHYYNHGSHYNNFPPLTLNTTSPSPSFCHTLITSSFSDTLCLLPTFCTLPPITLLLQCSTTSIYSTSALYSPLPLLSLKYILTASCILPHHLYQQKKSASRTVLSSYTSVVSLGKKVSK